MDVTPTTGLLTAVVALGAGLLLLAGVAKLAVPDGAMATLHRLHLPSGRIAARVLGVAEILAGVGIMVMGGKVAAAGSAIIYAALAAVAGWQRAAQVACGCFGGAATAVTRVHIGLNAGFAAAGAAGLAVPAAPLRSWVTEAGALAGGAGLLLLATGVGLLRLLLERAGGGTAVGTAGLAR